MSDPFHREPRGAGFNPFIGRAPRPESHTPGQSDQIEAPTARRTTTLNPTATATSLWMSRANNRASEETQLRTILDRLGRPNAIIIGQVIKEASEAGAYNDIANWLLNRKNRYGIPHRLAAAGYAPVRNPNRGTGLWLIAGVRQVAYARKDLSPEEQVKAVKMLQMRFKLIPITPNLELQAR